MHGDHDFYQAQRDDEAGGRWSIAWGMGCLIAVLLIVSALICTGPTRGQELPTDEQIAQQERDLRDAYDARRAAAFAAGDAVAHRGWLLRLRMIEGAITARELQRLVDQLLAEAQDDEPPADPAPTPDLPERDARGPIKNQSASNFVIDRPTRVVDGKVVPTAGAWFDVWDRRDELLPFALSNGIIRGYGGEGGSWGHGIYAHHSTVTLDDVWIYGPTRVERLGRDHPIYLSGSPLTATRLLIGHLGDEHPHTISLNITRGDNGPQTVDIETLVIIGGRRVVIEVDDDALARLHIGLLIVINPVTADGLWEGVEVQGCPDILIGEYVFIDLAGRWTSGALIKADDCEGEIGRAVIYAPNAPPSDTLIRGIAGDVERLDAPPIGDPPPVTGPESIPALIEWSNP
jgi:hypothetical protein